jgi:hypothetical protein
MLREKLEPKIDSLISGKLQEPAFLEQLLQGYRESILRATTLDPTAAIDRTQIRQKLDSLNAKRNRILDTFYEGIIDAEQRDADLGGVQREIISFQHLLDFSPKDNKQPLLELSSVLQFLEPFRNWGCLTRDDKRTLLRQLCPQISVYRYAVKSLTLNLDNWAHSSGCDGIAHPKMDASPSRAPLSP